MVNSDRACSAKDILTNIKPLVLGGAILNTQYNDVPQNIPIVDMLLEGIKSGEVNAIDTSPYYGDSEIIYGKALKKILRTDNGNQNNVANTIAREDFYVITKCGRIGLDEFNYDPEWIKFSVLRSLSRLNVDYLDVVYLHDVEFVEISKIVPCLEMLKSLKEDLKIIRHFGISGYPLPKLYEIAKLCNDSAIGPLDCILSYSHGCLQNNVLLQYYDRFTSNTALGCNIKMVSNGSILSMSLLANIETKSFHPASPGLKLKIDEIRKFLNDEKNIDIGELSTKYAIHIWHDKGPIVLGVSNVEELKSALKIYRELKSNGFVLKDTDQELIKHIQDNLLGKEFMNQTWKSGLA
ncbi:related to D-arabinose 1-dehydrogenase [Saccharomycodes ludwigii]|uniref:Related to D-arabinose 1-dehydrogenase n=1 Tax=Saccharomycodes ludwigii TaxID=36035 RepID=A0A376BBV9_9ASCO|nr:hypothetical protein SCDLUD_004142 [Saccharomycodes ludwigii]KAH3899844.1 hypothetical protein SCDLUD_004142 [Saccharomycodes ludwigii]SSD62071.1 related to D-arabinose 1-dehydrogenase [Saccharomycodes ludwigii]